MHSVNSVISPKVIEPKLNFSMKLKVIKGYSRAHRVDRRGRRSSPNNPTCLLSTQLANSTTKTMKTKPKHALFQLDLDSLHSCPRDTLTFLYLAQFWYLFTLSLRNDINRSIIVWSTLFGKNAYYIDFTKVEQKIAKLNPTRFLLILGKKRRNNQ